MSSRPKTREVKAQLFLRCGKVDMYSMEKHAKEKLALHHEPPFSETNHTVYAESYLLSTETHTELHRIEQEDREEYDRRMGIIKHNKRVLERKKMGR